jgi:hypothetical protein
MSIYDHKSKASYDNPFGLPPEYRPPVGHGPLPGDHTPYDGPVEAPAPHAFRPPRAPRAPRISQTAAAPTAAQAPQASQTPKARPQKVRTQSTHPSRWSGIPALLGVAVVWIIIIALIGAWSSYINGIR